MTAFDDKMRAALAAGSDEDALEIMRGESWADITAWLQAHDPFYPRLTTDKEN